MINTSATHHTMKALFLCVAIGAVAINVASNAGSNSTAGIQTTQVNRAAQLCQVDNQYCL